MTSYFKKCATTQRDSKMPKFTSNLYPQAFAFTESIIRQFGNSRNDLSRTSCVENMQNVFLLIM